MAAYILSFIVGAFCIVLGVSNMMGNLSSLHSYHRHRVSEEDRIPFGRRVGLGTVMVGGGVDVFSILSAVSLLTEKQIFLWLGIGIMLVSMAAGLILSFYAMIKYNKGIF